MSLVFFWVSISRSCKCVQTIIGVPHPVAGYLLHPTYYPPSQQVALDITPPAHHPHHLLPTARYRPTPTVYPAPGRRHSRAASPYYVSYKNTLFLSRSYKNTLNMLVVFLGMFKRIHIKPCKNKLLVIVMDF